MLRTHHACDRCGSSDAATTYNDGWVHCFSCGANYKSDSTGGDVTETTSSTKSALIDGEVAALKHRGITLDTCKRYGYMVNIERRLHIAPYRKAGKVVGQKLRGPDKAFRSVGDMRGVELFGQHLSPAGGKRLIITEGEIDALSVSQAWGNTWPVVSVPTGAQGAAGAIRDNIQWVASFDKVILMFDSDEPGRKATAECVQILPSGKAYIAEIPGYKDANEALVDGKEKLIIKATFDAMQWRPDGVVGVMEVLEKAMQEPVVGLPWWDQRLTDLTYGRRYGELYAIGAGTGVGKTDWISQQMAFDVHELGLRIGVLALEQQPAETVQRIAGKIDKVLYHVPGIPHDREAKENTIRSLDGNVLLYDSWGNADWDSVSSTIRYMATQGARVIYLDHLTAMADPDNERASLERLMKELARLTNELQLIVMFVSHLATPDGKPHEEGGRVMIRHFKGARAIGFWSFFMFGIERDQSDPDSPSTFRVLKDRYTGRSTGRTLGFKYNIENGIVEPCTPLDDDTTDAEVF